MHEKIKEIRFTPEKAQCFFSKLLAFTVGPIELKKLMEEDKVRIVDVRNSEDYEVSHIPSAISIPCESLDKNFDKLSKEEVTVVYSYNRDCHLSVKAALTLADYSYPVVLLVGGFDAWTEDYHFAVS